MATNHYPDGLTIEAITALQREVNDELRREGYPIPQAEPAVVAGWPAQSRRRRDARSSPRRGGSRRRGAGRPGSLRPLWPVLPTVRRQHG
ncbi:hypothetical protein ATK36_5338 [Amycolatopsis sulphurea]|uniref:Uncharacterized protein n=1 Tax=Amycolatopsis sulphurea TaxID=76022 RepID=A0A2A9FGT1_9PSEU|nr:hypothetical protein ATK36_5338 [Amycolatopsis sulphurea]